MCQETFTHRNGPNMNYGGPGPASSKVLGLSPHPEMAPVWGFISAVPYAESKSESWCPVPFGSLECESTVVFLRMAL